MKLDQNFWEQRWLDRQTGWDLGQASPALVEYAAQIPPERRDLVVLIPGCGNGHEALALLQLGFTNITMLDIAPAAIARIRAMLDLEFPDWQTRLRLCCADFFEIDGPFDLILEQTFFCALDPSLRSAYVSKMRDLLAPGGRLVGVLFDRSFEGGPPFGGDREEYRRLFELSFSVRVLETCYNSVAPRAGTEVFFIAALD